MAKEEIKALATTTNDALAPAPDWMEKGDRRGLETIDKSDMTIPRLALAQLQSPEVTEGDPKKIEGMVAGDLFNSVTKQNYGKNVRVQIIRKDAPRAMEFFPMVNGSNGGVKDPNVPIGDARLSWGANGEKPVATLFRDYLARILPSGELIALSFKSSGIKVAKDLNGKIALRNKPIFAGVYEISSAQELKPKPHKVYIAKNAGWVSQEDYKAGSEAWEAVKDLDTIIDRDETATDPAEEVMETTSAPVAAHTMDDKPPF